MKQVKLLMFLFSTFLFAQNLSGQNVQGANETAEREQYRQQQQIQDSYRRGELDERGMIANRPMLPSRGVPLSNTSEAEEKAERRSILKAKEMLEVPRSYREKFGFLVKDKNTELARLFIDKNCDRQITVTVEEIERCNGAVPIEGGGSYYSFRWESNFTGRGVAKDKNFPDERFVADLPDIHFAENNRFIVGSYTILGIISDVGELDFANINLSSPSIKFLAEYKPKIKSIDIENEVKLISRGINSNGFFYSTSAPVLIDHAYILRSIAYRTKKNFLFNRRDDLIIVFKILGQEADGSIIIVWKKIKKDKSPIFEN